MKQLCSLLLAIAVVSTATAAALPPDAMVEDKTIGEWSAEWWQWFYSISTNNHPAIDATGMWGHVNQPANDVFFRCGTYSISRMDTPLTAELWTRAEAVIEQALHQGNERSLSRMTKK